MGWKPEPRTAKQRLTGLAILLLCTVAMAGIVLVVAAQVYRIATLD